MKNIFISFTLVFAFVLWAQGKRNLVQNPSFEKIENNMPVSWSKIRRGTFDDVHFLEKTKAFDGKYSAGIKFSDPHAGRTMLIWGQMISEKAFKSIPAGTPMVLTAYVQALESPAQGKIYFESVRAGRTIVSRKKLQPGVWTPLAVRFTKENIAYPSAHIYLQLEGKGKILFDKVFFGPEKGGVKQPLLQKNLAANGDMEKIGKKGIPAGWYKIEHFKGGKLFVDRNLAYSGKVSLGLSSKVNPPKLMGWGYRLDGKLLKDVSPGTPMQVQFQLNTHGDPSTVVRCYVEFLAGKKYIGTTGKNFKVYNNWEKQTLQFKTPKEKPTHFWIYFMLKSPGTAHIDAAELQFGSAEKSRKAPVAESKDYCRLLSPPPQRTWILPERPRTLTIEYALSAPGLKISLNEIDGKNIKNWDFSSLSGKGRKVLSLPALKKGAFELIFKRGNWSDQEWFRIREKQTKGIYFDSENFMVFKGKRYFPIFVGHPGGGLDGLRVYSQAGINGISEYTINGKQHALYLDTVCKQFDMFLFLKEDFGSKSRQKGTALRKYVHELADNAALIERFIGFQSDEAAWQQWPLESVQRHAKYRFKYVPDYLTWQCNAPRLTAKNGDPKSSFASVRRYARAADVTGVDIYPVPEGRTSHNNLPNQTLSCVGDYTELVSQAVWHDRPIWMVLQAMGWSEEGGNKLTADRPRPTKKQLRFMVWNAVTHGATGICWYGNGAWNDHYSEWFRQFAEVNLELKAAAEVMMAGKALKKPQVPAKVGVLAREGILVLVNEDNKKTQTISVNRKWYDGKKLASNKIVLGPQEVVILTEKPLTIPKVKRFAPQKTQLRAKFGVAYKPAVLKGVWSAHPDYLRGEQKTFLAEHRFSLSKVPAKARLAFSIDDEVKVCINGKYLPDTFRDHRVIFQKNIRRLLKKGNNVIRFEVTNFSGPTGLVYDLTLDQKTFSSGSGTLFSIDGGRSWKKAHVFGRQPCAPWGRPNLMILDR